MSAEMKPVAWVVRIKKTHEFCDPTELYGDTAEEVVEISSAWNSEYSEPIPLYAHSEPPDTLLDEVLDALRIGEVAVIDDWELGAFTPQKEVMLWNPVKQIRSVIAALEKYRGRTNESI